MSKIGLVLGLTVIFTILKLCKVTDWNWFLVLSPTLFAIGVLFLVCFILGAIEIRDVLR